MAAMTTATRRVLRRRQRGMILIMTLVSLAVCMLGLVYAMRDTIINAQASSNSLAKQKAVQSSDIALRTFEALILNTYGGQPLEISADAQPWWRDVAAGTAVPDAAYWAACLGNTDETKRCGQITLKVGDEMLPYTALVVAQPTGRTDSRACELGDYMAVYYDLHVRLVEASGLTQVSAETVYKVCTLT